MKRVLSILLALCLLLGAVPVLASAADGDFTIENGVLVKYNGPGGDVVIPEGVTVIGDNAFGSSFADSGNAAITSVVIPEGVTSIGAAAFGNCSNLASVSIPGTVTSIGREAFSRTALTNVTIPEGVVTIDTQAFWQCGKLTGVSIPNTVTSIGTTAFGSTALTSVTLPDSVTHLGNANGDGNPFYACLSLPEIQVSSNNPAFVAVDGVLFTKDMKKLMAYPAGKAAASYTVPKGVTEINTNAFEMCKNLTTVNLPEGITDLGFGAFENCENLTAVNLPNSIVNLDACVFTGCTSLQSAVIPQGITTLLDGMFSGCAGLKSVTLPAGMTSIKTSGFYGCTALKDVYFGGTEAQWNAVELGGWNDPLKTASLHYNFKPAEPTVGGFSDVKASAYYADAVLWAVENGITNGIGGGKFGPGQICKREQIVTFLWNNAGKPEPTKIADFGDMPANQNFRKAISWAVENGITSGAGNNRFNPSKACTRAEAMTFIWRAAGKPEPKTAASFTDMPRNNADFVKAISWAVENGITNGVGGGKFGPNQSCRREHIVTFLYNARDVK